MPKRRSDFEVPELFDSIEQKRYKELGEFDRVQCREIDIPETIPALGYGSHQWFRYYGKFPSILGREIVARFAAPGTSVLDNYAGSGTTLVEAQIRGHDSFGIDINPLAVLASNVKTRYYEVSDLRDAFSQVLTLAMSASSWVLPESAKPKFMEKWFNLESQEGLAKLRTALLTLDPCPERDFLTTCFLGIVRRCSNAFDGEVRPHINKDKRPRIPLAAFSDKFEDMLIGLKELDALRPSAVASATVVADNRQVESYDHLGRVGLVVAHPPYLNSFNYLAVFSLEFMWAEGFDEVWQGWSMSDVNGLEQKAWPATNDSIKRSYYEGVGSAIAAAQTVLSPGGVLAVVVGDATILKKLEPVHRIVWDNAKRLGFEGVEVWYRTTHYGIGKYAYSHRADYHGESAEKRDAILFLRKPA